MYHFTRESKVGPETAEISRNIDPSKTRILALYSEVIVTAVKFTNRHFSHCDWPASLSRSIITWCAYVCIVQYIEYMQYSFALRMVY